MSRPEKPIDWKKVDDLLMAGCLGTEICTHFDMHPNSFYRRVEEEFGVSFTEYSSEKRQRGDSILRAKQYETAVKGSVPMQIWLGKNRLKQKDLPDGNTVYAGQEKIDTIHEGVKSDYIILKQAEKIKELEEKLKANESI